MGFLGNFIGDCYNHAGIHTSDVHEPHRQQSTGDSQEQNTASPSASSE